MDKVRRRKPAATEQFGMCIRELTPKLELKLKHAQQVCLTAAVAVEWRLPLPGCFHPWSRRPPGVPSQTGREGWSRGRRAGVSSRLAPNPCSGW